MVTEKRTSVKHDVAVAVTNERQEKMGPTFDARRPAPCRPLAVLPTGENVREI
jgi:hypothetical protein